MKVRLLVDLTSYNPRFEKGAMGESDMQEYVRSNYNPRKYVTVEIQGHRLPVGVEGVECLDEDYIAMKELEKKIARKELTRKLRNGKQACFVVGPQGGAKGFYVRTKDGDTDRLGMSREECDKLLRLCEEEKIEVTVIPQAEFHY